MTATKKPTRLEYDLIRQHAFATARELIPLLKAPPYTNVALIVLQKAMQSHLEACARHLQAAYLPIIADPPPPPDDPNREETQS